MRLEQIARPETGCLAYLVVDEATHDALAIDPPEDPAPVLERARALGARITRVAETHTHADHKSGARALAAKVGARIWLPEKSGAQFPHEAVRDGAELRVGDAKLRAIATPGHTADAMCFVGDGKAIVGDTLLVGTAGRADFYPQGPEELFHSLFDKLLKLDDAVVVYPAHYGPKHGLPPEVVTTIGHERRANEALTQKTKDDFVKYMTEGWPPKPHGWQEIVAANTQA
ncbi:MAG TPA: MBL fold metallo-hydrolase [Candidatus Thermoplasmatota archaeon]|jgi:glyoxylase-like metal-dependent hydrolase (beta-lactamase superfamily II)|nr:MBL fold metallo-hydrolase [Candidatus Thermoplasmatota archaeon]